MRLAVLAAPLAALLGLAAWPLEDAAADQGDRWSVNGQNVNVRSGPSTNTEVVMTINPGEAIVEIAAKGEWYFVEFPDQNKRGWVYAPLLVPPGRAPAQPAATAQPAAPAPTPTPAASEITIAAPAVPSSTAQPPNPQAVAETPAQEVATLAPGEEPAAVKGFRDTVAELNERAVSVAGINLFTDVRSIGGGGVQVLATETWSSVPEAGQNSYMNALFERWQSMASGLGPLTLQIVDPNGAVMMERSGS